MISNYARGRDGDRIFIVGFSRGAYSARALAGMIEKVGLLPPGNANQVSFAWRLYVSGPCKPHEADCTCAEEWKKTFSRSRYINVHFVGVL